MFMAGLSASPAPAAPDYFNPVPIRGTIHEKQSSNLLFRVVRASTRTNTLVSVQRDYTEPDGREVARERACYDQGRLMSCELEELQIDARGRAVIERDAQGQAHHIKFEYTTGHGPAARTKTDREAYRGDVLINDMVPYFIQSRWDELKAGRELKIRFIVIPRRETVGFTFSKVGETTWNGQPVVRLRMAPTSVVIAAIIDPVYFLVEKNGEHRVVAYIGRTVLKTKSGDDLDALNVFQFE
jgi:hypothetical protein